MNNVRYYSVPVASGASTTTSVRIEAYDSIQVYIPNVSSNFASGVVLCTLQGTPVSGVAAKDILFYDYVNKAPATSVITVPTQGVYEMPFAGPVQFLNLKFDVAATGTSQTLYLMAPKISY